MSAHKILQYGTIAWRRVDLQLELLLITSRETQRWVVPRGNAIKGLEPHMSAAQEAYEEAGVRGHVKPQPLGAYHYEKRLRRGRSVLAEVRLFPLEVIEELDDWPERHQRERRWFDPVSAADAVAESELKSLILAMALKQR